MALFRRRKPSGGTTPGRAASRADVEHLENFVRTRRGVEAFIEPQTTVTETTVMLIADDGEWTRRRIDSPENARRFAHRLLVFCARLVLERRFLRERRARPTKQRRTRRRQR